MASRRRPAPIKPPVTIQRDYYRRIHNAILAPMIRELEQQFKTATSIAELNNAVARVFGMYASKENAQAVAAQSLRRIERYHRSKLIDSLAPALGVDIKPLMTEVSVMSIMSQPIATNADLILSVSSRLKAQLSSGIEQIFAEQGFNQEAMFEMAKGRFGVSATNARRIARDQTNKAIGDLTQVRQEQVGVTEYIWRTAEDERVVGEPGGLYPTGNTRHMNHAERDGRRFRWDSPPPDGHPGQAIQCRCVAQAIIPEGNA